MLEIEPFEPSLTKNKSSKLFLDSTKPLQVEQKDELFLLTNNNNYLESRLLEIENAIALLSSSITNIYVTANSLPVEAEQSVNFTVVRQAVYPVNSSATEIIVTPLTNPQPNNKFAIVDSRASSNKNRISIDFAASNQKFYGSLQNFALNQAGAYAEFRFLNSEIGWIVEK